MVGYYSYQTILAALGEKLERFSIEKNKNGVVNSIIIVTLLLPNSLQQQLCFILIITATIISIII